MVCFELGKSSLPAKNATVALLGKGGAGKLIAVVNSVAVSVKSGHKAGPSDVDTPGFLAFKTP